MEQEEKMYCPYCGSSQLTANKKGFGAGKAVVGAALTGGIGLLAGFIGSGNVKVTCLKCGRRWNPGQLRTTPLKESEKQLYYEELRREEEEKKKQEEPMSTGAKIGCAIVFLLCIITMMLTCK